MPCGWGLWCSGTRCCCAGCCMGCCCLTPAALAFAGCVLAAFLHECGHILAYCALLRRFPVIEVTMTGFCMRMDAPAWGLSPGRLFWLAAAGPAVNFMLAGIWALRLEQELTIRGSAFWAANLLTGGFNLLPVPPLDGAQLASCLCEMRRAGKKFKGND